MAEAVSCAMRRMFSKLTWKVHSSLQNQDRNAEHLPPPNLNKSSFQLQNNKLSLKDFILEEEKEFHISTELWWDTLIHYNKST